MHVAINDYVSNRKISGKSGMLLFRFCISGTVVRESVGKHDLLLSGASHT